MWACSSHLWTGSQSMGQSQKGEDRRCARSMWMAFIQQTCQHSWILKVCLLALMTTIVASAAVQSSACAGSLQSA